MIINKIEIKNWKCFENKTVEFDEGVNLFRWPNGTGKSSLIEAIIFCVLDKKPNGLSFDDLRNDKNKECEITLYFTHNAKEYIFERAFGKSTKFNIYIDSELSARSKVEYESIARSVVPKNIDILWNSNSLAYSEVLNTNCLVDLLNEAFAEPLAYNKAFQSERTFAQKSISSLEKTLSHQNATQEELDKIENEIKTLKEELKSKTLTSDSTLNEARRCKENYERFTELKNTLDKLECKYDRETCLRLHSYGARTAQQWDNFFNDKRMQLEKEKNKAAELHPLARYPRNVIDSILRESEQKCECVVCGGKFKPIHINYDSIDINKINSLEKILQDAQYNFEDYAISVRYLQLKKQLDDLHFSENIDWRKILQEYDENTNTAYDTLNKKENYCSELKADIAKISDILKHKQNYNDAKECLRIIKEYIEKAKKYYSDAITQIANAELKAFSSRYSDLRVEDNVYRVNVHSVHTNTSSRLAVQTLSNGEKTLIALALTLAIKKLFLKDMPLIMDEAFANIDADNILAINSLLRRDTSQWVVVSHDERLQLERY